MQRSLLVELSNGNMPWGFFFLCDVWRHWKETDFVSPRLPVCRYPLFCHEREASEAFLAIVDDVFADATAPPVFYFFGG